MKPARPAKRPMREPIASRGFLPVYRIGDQDFCEMKVHLEYAHPELRVVRNAKAAAGKAEHAAAIADLEPAADASIISLLHAPGEHVFSEPPLEAIIGNVPFKGRPDFMVVKDGALRMILDLKLGSSGGLWKSDRMQVEAYALVAAAMGIDVSNAIVAIGLPAKLPGRGRAPMSPAAREEILQLGFEAAAIARRARGWKAAESADWRVHAAKFSEEIAREDIEFKLKYWRGERAPIPVTVEVEKCRSCFMNATGLCKDAHKAPDGSWKVERREGTILVRSAR